VEETYADMAALVDAYPGMVTWTDIGDSWEKITTRGNAGYDIYVLKLTNPAIPIPSRPSSDGGDPRPRSMSPRKPRARFAEYLTEN